MRDAVQKWLESGAEVQAGLRLLSLYAKNEHLAPARNSASRSVQIVAYRHAVQGSGDFSAHDAPAQLPPGLPGAMGVSL